MAQNFSSTLFCLLVFSFLTSCGADENDLELPGQLLLRDNEKLVILDGSGNIMSKFDVLASGSHWSPDGQRIVFNDSEFNISILELETGQQTRLFVAQGPFYPHVYDWSPNGQEITFIEGLSDEKGLGLYIVDAAGKSTPRLIWKCEYQCEHFQWASDEQHIFISERLPCENQQDLTRLIKVNARTGVADVLFTLDMYVHDVRWNPGEELVALVSYGEGTFIFDKNGRLQHLVTADDVGGLYWSPDGKWLAFNHIVLDPRSEQVADVYNVQTKEIQRLYPRGRKGIFEKAHHPYVLGWRE